MYNSVLYLEFYRIVADLIAKLIEKSVKYVEYIVCSILKTQTQSKIIELRATTKFWLHIVSVLECSICVLMSFSSMIFLIHLEFTIIHIQYGIIMEIHRK